MFHEGVLFILSDKAVKHGWHRHRRIIVQALRAGTRDRERRTWSWDLTQRGMSPQSDGDGSDHVTHFHRASGPQGNHIVPSEILAQNVYHQSAQIVDVHSIVIVSIAVKISDFTPFLS